MLWTIHGPDEQIVLYSVTYVLGEAPKWAIMYNILDRAGLRNHFLENKSECQHSDN